MLYEFPDNLSSSQNGIPEKQGSEWQQDVKFLQYFPKNQSYGREQQQITKTIKDIEGHYQAKIAEMVTQILVDEQGTLNIIPKKANIDLKRSIQPKLNKLKKRTERTIIQMLSIQIYDLDEKYQKIVPKKEEQQGKFETEKEQDLSININVYDKEIDLDEDDDEFETE